MLITKTHHDVKCADGSTNRIFVISPVVPNYPQAKFPGENIIETDRDLPRGTVQESSYLGIKSSTE